MTEAAARPLPRLEALYERAGGVPVPLPDAAREAYGGVLTFPESAGPHVFANFVSTLDGLVSYGIPGLASSTVISGRNAADRFVVGMLRAVADVVVSGSGTLRAEPKIDWTPRQVFPAGAEVFREIRRARGLPERIRVAILTSSGDVDLGHPVFRSEAVAPLIVTSRGGAERLSGRAGRVEVRVVGERELTTRDAIAAIAAASGARLVLSEAGPRLFGRMLEEGVVNELFLTLAPTLAGRAPDRPGVGLVDPLAFTPDHAPRARLISAKRSDDLLFLRYAMVHDL